MSILEKMLNPEFVKVQVNPNVLTHDGMADGNFKPEIESWMAGERFGVFWLAWVSSDRQADDAHLISGRNTTHFWGYRLKTSGEKSLYMIFEDGRDATDFKLRFM